MKDKAESIKKYVVSRLGAPIVDLCDQELNAMDVAFEAASTRYWTAFPHQSTSIHEVAICTTNINQDIDALKTSTFTDTSIHDSSFFLGIGRYDLSNNSSFNVGGSNYFDQRLLGKNVGYQSSNYPTEDPRYLADRTLLSNTEEDFLTGELDYRHDVVNNSIKFITPNVHGRLHVWYNWGFCCEKTLELLPMLHFEIFKRMVTLEFIEIAIAARSSAIFSSADIALESSDLISRRDKLAEDLEKDIPLMSTTVGIWG